MSMTRKCNLCGTLTDNQGENLDKFALCAACRNAVLVYRERTREGLCPFCGNRVKVRDFRDGLSLKEFLISGLCQSCQDGVFG